MLIHIGNGYLVRDRDVVGLFDIDGSVTPAITADFLKSAERGGRCASAVLDLPRSFVLEVPTSPKPTRPGSTSGGNNRKNTKKERDELVILSHLSTTALAGRVSQVRKKASGSRR